MKTLTPKQKRFVDEYLVDLNASKAAIRAGYSKKSSRSIGAENLTKPNISAAVSVAFEEKSARTKITADYIISRLCELESFDFSDIMNPEGEIVNVTDWPAKARRSVIGIERKEIFVDSRPGRIKIGVTWKIWLEPRSRALGVIAKLLNFDERPAARNSIDDLYDFLAEREKYLHTGQ